MSTTNTKPRILCLHGGGVNASIFRLQFRCFLPLLEPHFRLVFADAPFLSEMHDDLKPVYAAMGPCYRWSRWLPSHPAVDNESAIAEVEYGLTSAMRADAGTGEWVGLIGFSQGAKLAFSVLMEGQLRNRDVNGAGDGDGGESVGFAGARWKFGILMAGRAPPFRLCETRKAATASYRFYPGIAELPLEHYDYAAVGGWQDRLGFPTLHVHGLRDPGIKLHRDLLKYFCDPTRVEVVEWDGGHRIPFKSTDVKVITEGIFKVAAMV